jgi:ribosomal protein S18 acetylase RimI-like enzyme
MEAQNFLIREARLIDLDEITRLYCEFMFDSSMLQFGSAFVKQYLKVIMESKNCFSLVAESKKPIGFIMATFNCRKMFFEFISNIKIMSILFRQFLIHPAIVFGALELTSYFFKARMENVKAEFLFIAIDPAYRRKDIATNLILRALDSMRLRKVKKIKLTTLVKNNAINTLLKKEGFKIDKTLRLFKKDMFLYSYSLP